MKTRLIVLLVFFASAFHLKTLSQNKLSGTINNEAGQPIGEVKIMIDKSYNYMLSDQNGRFEFTNLPAAKYQLLFSALGYENLERVIDVSNGNAELTIVLKTSVKMIEEVQVSAVRAGNKTPTTYTNLNAKQIEQNNFGQDLPYLLESTPSTVVTSDAGAGIGYTGVRIRGVDPTRTNVTVNGIPLNDPESHAVYWVNMPDFASSTDNIQVQRGVGTSTNGAAAFGASINIKSDNINKNAYAELDNSIGSFNTFRTSVKAGTGLINEKFTFDTRLSRISSDGYIDRATSDLKAFYVSGAYVGKKSLLKAVVFSGREKTYQAWYGIPEAKLKGNSDSLNQHFYNNYYPGGLYQSLEDSANLFNAHPRTYNYYTYDNETDNYQQDHYQLHFTHSFNPKWILNLAGHYTKGRGYYEQFRQNDLLSTYSIEPAIYGADTIQTSDLIRRRWLDNDFFGGIFSLSYNNLKNLQLLFGGGINQYLGQHFGEVIWARTAANSEIRQRYYDNEGIKTEANAYLKANYQLKKWNFFADLQVRQLNYSYLGFEQLFDAFVPLEQSVAFTFFNPKVGLSVDLNKRNALYASFSTANREPTRDDFVQSSVNSRPKAETLRNIEAGYRFHGKKAFVNANYYLMHYTNQLILTGEINDVGAYVRTNVPTSYRMGLEVEAGYQLHKTLTITGNAAFSSNKITRFTEYVDNYDNYDSEGNMIQDVIEHRNTSIAFSPDFIGSLTVAYTPFKGFELRMLSKYVGSQFLDNTSNQAKMLDAYFISNLSASYSIKKWIFRDLTIGVLVNNLFNEMYENNGYTWGYIYGGKRITENYYYPQAGTNFLARLTLKF